MFYIFPQVVPKSECRKLLKYCIKNTKFKDADVVPKGKVGQSDDGTYITGGRNDPSIRKTDI